MPPLHFFYPNQEHPLHKKRKLKSPPNRPKNKTKQKKKKKKKKKGGGGGGAKPKGELILRILPRRNSLDERECRIQITNRPDKSAQG